MEKLFAAKPFFAKELPMTSLRRRMIEDMQVGNLSLQTQATYVQQVSLFARHFNKSPEILGPEEIRSYQVYLTNEKKLAPSSIIIAVAALRFLYKVTLREVLQLCRSGRISWADMVLAPSVAGLFKWRQFEPEVILLAIGWYLRFSLSYRDVEELLAERGLRVDHVTVWRWVQRYAPEVNRRLRSRLKPTNDSWRVDETYVRVKGKWVYLYRAVDSDGATIDFLLSAKRDAAAAERFLTKALGGENHPTPRVINTDKYAAYPPAIVQLKAEEALEENCQHRSVQYLNNVLEQDHRAIKRRIRASQHFRSFWGAWRTIAGYEAIHMIRKGQAYGSAAGAKIGLLHRFILGLFAATNCIADYLPRSSARLQSCNTSPKEALNLFIGPIHPRKMRSRRK
jgi:transposase, IS6 family